MIRHFKRALTASLAVFAVMLGILAFSPMYTQAASGKWVQNSTGWRYKKGSSYVKKQFLQIGDKYYYMDKSGYVTKGWFTVDGNKFYGKKSNTKEKAGLLRTGWMSSGKKIYFFSEHSGKGQHGRMLVGWRTIDNHKFYFDSKGLMASGWKTIDGKRYYFTPSGALGVKGQLETGWVKPADGGLYYFKGADASGSFLTGWQTLDSKLYYFDANGKAATGLTSMSGGTYSFSTDGVLQTGWIKNSSTGRIYYLTPSGAAGAKGKAVTGWQIINGTTFYFDASGALATGETTINGFKYLLEKSGNFGTIGAVKTGWYAPTSSNVYYYSKREGAGQLGKMLVGWRTIDGHIFYFDANGLMKTGLVAIDGKTFYFAETGPIGSKGILQTGWQTVDGKKHYFSTAEGYGAKGAMYVNKWGPKQGSGMSAYKSHFNSKGEIDKKSLTKTGFVTEIKKLARADMKKTGVLASVTAAQAILESGYGLSGLSLEGNNLFGIKASSSGTGWAGSTWVRGNIYRKETSEYYNGKHVTIVANFRAYKNWDESIEDHSMYLLNAKKGSSKRYPGIKNNKDPKQVATIIKKGGYATDPNYVASIMGVIKKYNLTALDK